MICGALIAWRILTGKREPGYLAIAEYWIYTPSEKMPDQTAIMERVMRGNPHNRPGRPAITQREGLLFSDIRLHLGLAKRAKNPHIFRPDVFEENAEPNRDILGGLSTAASMIKVRYISESKLPDTRHLVFLPHVADAVADLSKGTVVFDHVTEIFWTAEQFRAELSKDVMVDRPELHCRVVWKRDDEGAYAQTLGLRKVGMPEIRTEPQEDDVQVLIQSLLLRLAHLLIRAPWQEGPYKFAEYGDEFILAFTARKKGYQYVSLTRRLGQE